MTDTSKEIEFIDNGTAPEFFANGLHDVEVMGANSRFVLFVIRRTAAGVFYREPCFTCIMPNEAIGPAIALTLRSAGTAVVVPAAKGLARELARGWLH